MIVSSVMNMKLRNQPLSKDRFFIVVFFLFLFFSFFKKKKGKRKGRSQVFWPLIDYTTSYQEDKEMKMRKMKMSVSSKSFLLIATDLEFLGYFP